MTDAFQDRQLTDHEAIAAAFARAGIQCVAWREAIVFAFPDGTWAQCTYDWGKYEDDDGLSWNKDVDPDLDQIHEAGIITDNELRTCQAAQEQREQQKIEAKERAELIRLRAKYPDA